MQTTFMDSDIIFIDRLQLSALIGTTDIERNTPQTLRISARFFTQPFTKNDNLESCIDYSILADRIRDLVAVSRCNLIETLAQRIAESALEEIRVSHVWVKIEKNSVKSAEGVGVEIWRSAEKK